MLEIFVTDKYGFNVCMSGHTSDYVQIDEAWWLAAARLLGDAALRNEQQVYEHAKQDGAGQPYDGAVHLAAEFDDSAEAWGVPVSFPVTDNGRLIGVTKVVLDLGKLEQYVPAAGGCAG